MAVTASKSALLLSPCIRWAWDGAKPYEDKYADTTKRDLGTNFHLCMDEYYRSLHLPPQDALANAVGLAANRQVLNWVMDAVEWSRKYLEPDNLIASEVYVATDFRWDLVHMDPSVRNRQYPDMPGFTHGTCDLVCLGEGNELVIADWKTGKGQGAREQLMTLACGIVSKSGHDGPVVIATLYVSDSGVRAECESVTEQQLQEHFDAMGMQLQDVGRRTEPVPGIWCSQLYCPHLAYCPGINNIVQEAAIKAKPNSTHGFHGPKHDISGAPTDDRHAGYIMERVTAAKRQLAFYEERVRRYVTDGGRCLSGGYEFSKKSDGFRWRQAK